VLVAVQNGDGLMLPVSQGHDEVTAWISRGEVQDAANCHSPGRPGGEQIKVTPPTDASTGAAAAADALSKYFTAVDAADYAGAYHRLSLSQQNGVDYSTFADRLTSSFDFGVVAHSMTEGDDGSVRAWITFTSLQAPWAGPNGDTCDHWSLDYTITTTDGSGYRIAQSVGHGGGAEARPCS
jgi:hypothetical protein